MGAGLATRQNRAGIHLRVVESENDLEKKSWTLKS